LKNPMTIREQWHAPVVAQEKDLAGHLREICVISEVIRGKAGDQVQVPYVKDFDFDVIDVDGTLTEATGIYGVKTATLKEAGKFTQITYGDVEKLDADILAKIEDAFRRAAIRAEDKVILDTMEEDADVIEYGTGVASFDLDHLKTAIQKIQQEGKAVTPGQYVLVLSPKFEAELKASIVGTIGFHYVTPEVFREGRIVQILGVQVLTSAYLPVWDAATGNVSAFLLRRNSAVLFAPKRELLFETEKDTVARKIKMTGTHTFACAVIDPKEIVEIKMSSTLT